MSDVRCPPVRLAAEDEISQGVRARHQLDLLVIGERVGTLRLYDAQEQSLLGVGAVHGDLIEVEVLNRTPSYVRENAVEVVAVGDGGSGLKERARLELITVHLVELGMQLVKLPPVLREVGGDGDDASDLALRVAYKGGEHLVVMGLALGIAEL